MFRLWSFFTHRSRFSIILILAIVLLGVRAINTIPKESNPSVSVPIAIVATILPGGSTEDVEKLVTNVLEDPLKNTLSDTKKITSQSTSGLSVITIEFNTSADITKSMRAVRDEVARIKSDLPDTAEEPQITQINFNDTPVVTATVSATIPSELLYRLGEETSDELKKIPGVASVSTGGIAKKEVSVVVSRTALNRYGLTITNVARSIKAANIALPVGDISVNGTSFPVRLAGDIRDPSEVANIPILSSKGIPLYVKDVARVIDGRAKTTVLSRTSIDGGPVVSSISFNIFKNSDAKITDVSTAVQKEFTKLTSPKGILSGMNIVTVYDNGEKLRESLTTLTRSGMQTVLLVTLVLLLAVGWREALIAAISIPLSFLLAFIGMQYSGNTLNFVSLFALILSIGIIVDSTIVIVEGINRRLHQIRSQTENETKEEKNHTKMQAALSVVREFHIPLTAGTMTTVVVFVPLFIVSGITGEFIQSIPFTIIFVLMASLLVALGFVPLLAIQLLRRRGAVYGSLAQKRDAVVARIEDKYKIYLARFLTQRESQNTFFATLIILFIISLSLPMIGAVQVVFFGNSNADYVFIQDQMPIGTELALSSKEIKKAEEILYSVPEIQSFITTVGRTSAFADPFGGVSKDPRFSSIFITLNKDRNRSTTDILESLRKKLRDIHTSTFSVQQLSDGPPSLAPITLTIYDNDLAQLDDAVNIVSQTLKSIPGTTGISSSVKNNTNEFVFRINRAQVVAYGTSIGAIASSLRTALYGDTSTEIKKLGKDVQISIRMNLTTNPDVDPFATNATTIETLSQIKVMTKRGLVPISTFTRVDVAPSRAVITHQNGIRMATVSSMLVKGGNTLTVTNKFKSKISKVQLPDGVRITFGGENKDINQSFSDMFTALIIGMVSMFAILVLQFNSFRYAFYILAIVPLSLIGVFIGLLITGSPLSFPSIMGFIALSGIVVNNAIIMIDTIHNERKRLGGSLPLRDIIVGASTLRLRPVLLTALTTVVGMIPLLFAAEIWVPLAYALMFGLSFATIITLVLVPAIYLRWPGKLN